MLVHIEPMETIVFTISRSERSGIIHITSNNLNYHKYNRRVLCGATFQLYEAMATISSEMNNNEGKAVLFQIE